MPFTDKQAALRGQRTGRMRLGACGNAQRLAAGYVVALNGGGSRVVLAAHWACPRREPAQRAS